MNKRIIVYILGWVLIIEGAAMQIATVTSFIYGEHEGLYFLFTGAASAVLGFLAIKIKKPKNILNKYSSLLCLCSDNKRRRHAFTDFLGVGRTG